jgi:hypothetical protein
MTRTNWKTIAIAIMLVLIPVAAVASCAVPGSPGVVICAPANGQTVNYPAEITAAARAANGLPITAINIYVDGLKVLGESHVSQVDDIDFGIKQGTHSLTVHAWDSSGQMYAAKETFSVLGGNEPTCTPSSPGIKFCSPANGSYQPESDFKSLIGALGQGSAITKLSVWFDNEPVGTVATNNFSFDAGTTVGTHTESAKAWDAAGHTYTAAVTFKTYYDANCDPYGGGCNPGVFITAPANGAGVGTSFQISAEVKENPAPIIGMKAYLDGVKVASSSGPTLLANVTAAAGSHRLNVQAWDNKGNLYKTVETFSVK